MATPVPPADADLLRKLLTGELPPAEADRLATEYADDGRLADLARTLNEDDTLLEALRAQPAADPADDQMAERLVGRLKVAINRREETVALPAEAVDDGQAETVAPGENGEETPEPIPATLEYFRIEKVLGEGGMGTVYLAEDTRLGRKVAVKTLKKEIAKRPGAKDRFFREARTAAKLDHDHIIPIHYVGEAAGVPFLAMPFLKGLPLDSHIKKSKTLLPLSEVLRIGREVALGLAAAHEAGLIHRDIKPANVWLEAPHGRVKILDFGLARSQSEEGNLTASGAVMGTPAYMAPEQARGKPVDARADLFSLGVMLYEMTTGKKPFTGPDMMAILTSLALDDPPRANEVNPAVPAKLADLIARLMAKEPGRRPQSANVVADELMALTMQTTRPTFEMLPETPAAPAPAPAAAAADPWGGIDDTELPAVVSHAPKAPTKSKVQARPKAQAEPVTKAKPAAANRGGNKWLLPVASLFGFLVVTAGVIVIIRDKDGKKVAEVHVPEGGKVEVVEQPKAPPAKLGRDVGAARVLEVHGVTLDALKTWAAKLPNEYRPAWVAARAGGGPLFDAVATAVPAPRDWKLVFRAADDGKPYEDLVKTHRLAATGTYRNGDRVENFILGVQDGEEWEYWFGGADFIGEKITEGLGHVRDRDGVKERWLPLALAAHHDGGGVAYFLTCAWLPDRACEWLPDLDADGLTKAVEEYRLKGWRPHIINNHVGRPDAKFLAVFLENTADDAWDFTPGLSVGEFEKQYADRRAKGQGPRCVCSHGTAGKAFYTVVWDALAVGGDVDRKAAEYVLSVGGTVMTRVNGAQKAFKAAADLPNEAFELTAVYLINIAKVSDTRLAALKGCKGLESVGINNMPVGDAGLANLGDSKNLLHFSVAGTKITDAGLLLLKNWPNLQHLGLSGTQIGDAGLANAKDLRNLTNLNLQGTQVTDGGLLSVKNFILLERLVLNGTKVTAKGVDELKTVLPRCRIEWDGGVVEPPAAAADRKAAERVLSLGGRVFVDDKIKEPVLAAAGLPKAAFRLTGVHLENVTALTDADLAVLRDAPNLKIVSLVNTTAGDAGLAHLGTCKRLTTVFLINTRVTDAGLAHLRACKDITRLVLTTTQITDAGLAHLKAFAGLLSLDLTETKVTDAGLAGLKDFSELVELHLITTSVSDAGLEHLKACRKLTHIRLLKTKVTASKVAELSKALPQCRIEWDGGVVEPTAADDRKAAEIALSLGGEIRLAGQEAWVTAAADLPKAAFRLTGLDFNNNPKVTDADLAAFKDCTALTSLNLTLTPVGDAGLAHLKGLTNLTQLNMSYMGATDVGLAHLKDCNRLTQIDLHGLRVTDAGLAHFTDCKGLVHLGLRGVKVTDAGVAPFAALPALDSVDLPETAVTDAGLAAFHKCKTLTFINVDESKVTAKGYAAFKAALPKCGVMWGGDIDRKAALHAMSLGGRVTVKAAAGDVPAGAAAELPAGSFQLVGVIFNENPKVTDADMEKFKDCLELKTVVLQETAVGDAGVAHLRACGELQTLVLNKTKVTAAGLAFLADFTKLNDVGLHDTAVGDEVLPHLKKSAAMTMLLLDRTKVTDAGLVVLATFPNLTELHVEGTAVTPAGVAAFAKKRPQCKVWAHGVVVEPAKK